MTRFRTVYYLKVLESGRWLQNILADGRPVLGRKEHRFTDYDQAQEYAQNWFPGGVILFKEQEAL